MSLLFYDTTKIVRIRDKRLGALYYAIFAVMFSFSLSSLSSSRAHLAPQVVTGGVFQVDVKDEQPLDLPAQHPGGKPAWRLLDPVDAVRPMGDGGIFVVTHVKERLVRRVCPVDASECPGGKVYETVSTQRFSVRGAERFTLRLVHAFEAGDFVGHSKDLQGRGLGHLFPAGRAADKVTLTDLLRSANVSSLDAPSGELGHEGELLRDRGLTLSLTAEYANLNEGSPFFAMPQQTLYTYRARRIPGSARLVEAENGPEPGTRIIRKVFGVRIVTHQSGTLYTFSSSGAAFALGSALGLLGLVTTIVDLIVMYASRVHAPLKVEITRKI
jgi:hypothetical protein